MGAIFQHPKIAELTPSWTPFPGYSYILDQSGDQESRFVFARDPETIEAFSMLDGAIESFGRGRLMRDLWLCPLDPATYHVTAMDIINQANIDQVDPPPTQILAKKALDSIGTEPAMPAESLSELGISATSMPFNIRFRVAGINNASRNALMVKMAPLDSDSEQELLRLTAWRDGLGLEILQGAGLGQKPYRPHITLGYYAFRGPKNAHKKTISEFEAHLLSEAEGHSFRFDQVSLYQFTDMENYHRISG